MLWRMVFCLLPLLAGCGAKVTQEELDSLREEVIALHHQGKYPEAVVVAQKSVQLAGQINKKGSCELADQQLMLGSCLMYAGSLDEAEVVFLGALAAYQASGKSSIGTGKTLSDLGTLYSLKKDFVKSENAFVASFSEFEKLGKVSTQQNIETVAGFGAMLIMKGDLDKADEVLRLVLKACREEPGLRVRLHIATLNNIGEVAFLREDWKLAAKYYQQGLDMAEAELPEDQPLVASLKKNVGNARAKLR